MTKQELKDKLKTNNLKIIFTKKDGSDRTMICSLNPDFLKVTKTETETLDRRKDSDYVISVIDVELGEWRSIIIDNIVEIIEG